VSDQQAPAVIDAEREIGRAVFRRIVELRARPSNSPDYWDEETELRALEAIVLAVTGGKG
jgi:hypothetical protein